MWSWEGPGAGRWGLPVPQGTHIIRFSGRKGRKGFNPNPCPHWELSTLLQSTPLPPAKQIILRLGSHSGDGNPSHPSPFLPVPGFSDLS